MALRRPLAIVAAAALAAAAASVIGIVAIGSDSRDGGSAYAAELVAIAESNDRVLITGWTVIRADEFSVDQGEMTFSDLTDEIELRWGPSADYASYVKDRNDPEGTDQLGSVTVLGRVGLMFRYTGSEEYTTLVEPAGDHYLELRGDVGSEAAYRQVIASIHTVDVQAWLEAMPASVVKPTDRTMAIDQMLVGIPLPSGFDRAALDASTGVNDRYQLGAKVTGAVICGWFDQWFTATEQGDAAAAQTASDALISSRDWAIFHEMASSGDWPRVVGEYANATAGGTVGSGAGPTGLTRENAAGAFGCPVSVATQPTVPS